MSLGKKKTILISVGVVLLGTAAYGSLLWWQLQTFDKMGEDLSVRNMGLFALEQERLGGDWLHRDLALRLGFREDDGLSEVFLEMKGRFYARTLSNDSFYRGTCRGSGTSYFCQN